MCIKLTFIKKSQKYHYIISLKARDVVNSLEIIVLMICNGITLEDLMIGIDNGTQYISYEFRNST